MCFDNLTLAGLLVTVLYIVMLITFIRVSAIPVTRQTWVLECSEQESYCSGT